METPVRDSIWMFITVIAAAALIVLALPMARMAHTAQNESIDRKAVTEALAFSREWSRYEGIQTGADMIGFVARHKDACDIVIRNIDWEPRLIPYLTDNALLLGTAGGMALPDYIWDTAFLFDVILAGDGGRRYTASLLYDGQLTPGEGYTVTGIDYREVLM